MVPRWFRNMGLLVFLKFYSKATVVPRWFRMVPRPFGITPAMSSQEAVPKLIRILKFFCIVKYLVFVFYSICSHVHVLYILLPSCVL